MKNNFLLMILSFMLISSIAFGKTFDDSWGDHGFTILEQRSSNLSLNFSINDYSITNQEAKSGILTNIHIPGVFLPNNEGTPNLPVMSRYIAIPEGASVSFDIIDYRTEVIPNIDIAPASRIQLDTEDDLIEYNKNMDIYSKNVFYPADPVLISEVKQIRGVDVVLVSITPFQYNPVTKELIVYRDMQIDINFIGGNGQFGEDRLRSRWWDPIYAQSILNYESIPEKDYSYTSSKDEGCDYLIVIPDDPDFIAWADTIRTFRQEQGIITKVVTISEIGSNDTTAIETYIDNAYNNWDNPPSAVLLMADYGNEGNTITAHRLDHPGMGAANYISDNIYADVDGDSLPGIHFARMTARDSNELEKIITKFIDYETNPPTDYGFYNHPITCCGWQTDRWFQICAETIGGFIYNNLGKDRVRINEIHHGNPYDGIWSTNENAYMVLDYFGPDGLQYIPSDPADLGNWAGGTADDITNAINDGAFIILHRDHGRTNGWSEPEYRNDDLDGLHNDKLPFVFSINCKTGQFDSDTECFAEAFHRYDHRALGIIAATQVSYSFVNDAYAWGMFDYMWPDFMLDYGANPTDSDWIYPCMANTAGKIFLHGSSWPSNPEFKEITYNLFHHHGDAFTTIYTEVPIDLSVTHNSAIISGETIIEVTADAGADICLTVDGEIIGFGIGNGLDPTIISVEPQNAGTEILVTVVKQNYFRYEGHVIVVPSSGPYVVFDDYSINDSNGNNNGKFEYGEDILLGMTLKNIGIQDVQNIIATLSTGDRVLAIIDSLQEFGDIQQDQSATVDNAYEFRISNNIEDQTRVTFDLNIVGEPAIKEEWNDVFQIVVNAPQFNISNFNINDSTGNANGCLDPGENITVSVDVTNNGHAVSPHTTAYIRSNDYIIINSATNNLGNLDIDEIKTTTFDITIADDVPSGAVVPLEFEVIAGEYNVTQMYSQYVGHSIEDFETGDLSAYDWILGGNEDWTIVHSGEYEGSYCARSGDITHEESSELSITLITDEGEISFFRNVSCEDGYDYLRFYIDDEIEGEWTGETGWGEVYYPVSAGIHTYTWIYIKDYVQSGGEDCAWIDYITFPPILSTTPACFISPISIDFGDVEVTKSLKKQFTIYNLGNDTLSGAITTPACFFVTDEDTDELKNSQEYSLAMLEKMTFFITFIPEYIQNYDSQVVVEIDSFETIYVEVLGTGVPEVSIDDEPSYNCTELFGSFPNPAKDHAVIQYHIKGNTANQEATFRIYNIRGEYVKTVSGTKGNAHIDTSDMVNGIYFYMFDDQDVDDVRKMILVK